MRCILILLVLVPSLYCCSDSTEYVSFREALSVVDKLVVDSNACLNEDSEKSALNKVGNTIKLRNNVELIQFFTKRGMTDSSLIPKILLCVI